MLIQLASVRATAISSSTGTESVSSVSVAVGSSSARNVIADKAAQARIQGYEGDACSDCGNFTLVRNGTCGSVTLVDRQVAVHKLISQIMFKELHSPFSLKSVQNNLKRY